MTEKIASSKISSPSQAVLGEGAKSTATVALCALLVGAVFMGISPVFVRLADVGPFTSAFWRVCAALPVLWVWSRTESKALPIGQGWSWPVVIAGALFAGDLFFWHLAIVHTSIANATFLATLAPVWVLLGSSFILREPVTANMWGGLMICLIGAGALLGSSLGLAPERLLGDAFGGLTSVFFGGYFLATRYARRSLGPDGLMFRSSIVTAAILFLAALFLEDALFPQTWLGVAALAGLVLMAHAAGQGLLAYALGRLTAGFSALVIFLEALIAAVFAWVALGETLTILQIIGGAMILSGIWFARPSGAAILRKYKPLDKFNK
ncbi:DMT family transporter [Roseibium algae]|uniref:DMT family transporter n=1 Tax=Roseibium algae TaxID=3123038 RepID=A0ABU8TG12_9HYPH